MILYYLSSVFICSDDDNEPGGVAGSDDAHEPDEQLDDAHIQVAYKPEHDTLVVHIQGLHMCELPSALKSHDMSSTSMLLEKIILLISYILMIKLFV